MGTQPPPQKGGGAPQFFAHVYCGKIWLDGSRWHLAWSGPWSRPHCIRRGPSFRERGIAAPPLFGPCLLWPRSPISATAELLFLIVDTCLSCEDRARQSCVMGPRWRFLGPAFAASHEQHISDMHSKFALRPHHVWKYGTHPICNGWRLGNDKKRKNKLQDKNITFASAMQGGHNKDYTIIGSIYTKAEK